MMTDYHLPEGRQDPPSPRSTISTSWCSFSRNWLVHVANETCDIGRKGHYVNGKGDIVEVGRSLQAALTGSIHYHHSHLFRPLDIAPTTDENLYKPPKYHVIYATSLQAAAKLRGLDGDIGILNSASARNPGGKFLRGTVSQEDCICRASLLYPCLVQFDRPDCYYSINRGFPEGTSSSCAIFSPRVPVIRQDSQKAPLLGTYQECSFVSIPAPNAFVVASQVDQGGDEVKKERISKETLIDALYDRLFRALSIFAEQGCRHLVLCAFGCGVHGNDPNMVAEIFREILDNKFKVTFETVVFGIQPSRYHNYRAFTSVFPDALTSL